MTIGVIPVIVQEFKTTPTEEVAKSEKKIKKKPKERSDDDLFGNTDDIFGDLPATSPKPRKAKKKSAKNSNGKGNIASRSYVNTHTHTYHQTSLMTTAEVVSICIVDCSLICGCC